MVSKALMEKYLKGCEWTVVDILKCLEDLGAPVEEACIEIIRKKDYEIIAMDELWNKQEVYYVEY